MIKSEKYKTSMLDTNIILYTEYLCLGIVKSSSNRSDYTGERTPYIIQLGEGIVLLYAF